MEFDGEDIGVRLKTSLDISDLRGPNNEGAEFEIDENDLQKADREEGTDYLKEFDKNRVASNMCFLSDDDGDDDNLEDNDAEFLTEMEKLRRKMEGLEGSDISERRDKGVLKQLKSHGVGPIISPESLVCIHYNAYTDVGQAPYDSSKLRDSPEKIRLGKGKCIHGLEVALLTMKKGETSRFLIREDYAYGQMGCPPRIPANASLIYDVEVLYFVNQEGVDDYYSLTPAERKTKMTYPEIEKVAKAAMGEGKEHFARKTYVGAKKKYSQAIRILEDYHLKNDEEERQMNVQLLRANVNAAICENFLGEFGRTISHCNNALRIDNKHVKALYFKGKALHSLSSFEDARECLKRARSLRPSDTTITKALQQLSRSMKQYNELNKDFCAKMFSKSAEGNEKTEKKKGATKEDEEEATFGKCSEEFRAKVEERLRLFSEDAEMSEMPFPQLQLSTAEINCILETAEKIGGLNVRRKGTGNAARFEVYKMRR